MSDVVILFIFLTGAIAATLFFLQGAFRIMNSEPSRKAMRTFRDFILDRPMALHRTEDNPVLEPTARFWEAGGVMNPAAVYARGRVHLFYRAIGMDGVSRVGYASSEDGLHFDTRLPLPVFALTDIDAPRQAELRQRYHPLLYEKLMQSGGTWAGVEDPRAVVVDDRLYLSFSAFKGWDSLRIGVASIALDDMEMNRWNWTKPVFLSAPSEIHKNWVLFPRKINDKYAVLHGFRKGTRRRVLVEYLDSLDTEPAEYVKSDSRFRDEFDDNVWDSRVRGSGPPPIETQCGWLVLYHANDVREPHKYKLGALLLDKHDLTKVIARSPYPILEPDMPYENNGKAGVIYVTGAVVKDGMLIVYYGGGDTRVCSAAAPLDQFVSELMGRKKPALPIRASSLVPQPA
ncbi:MAG TPA: hypothetical protein VHB93_00290 [Candidatus Paceibacterota bacterium]|nr:hypothetical protein [Candidatus Paceibacterota bacterium]